MKLKKKKTEVTFVLYPRAPFWRVLEGSVLLQSHLESCTIRAYQSCNLSLWNKDPQCLSFSLLKHEISYLKTAAQWHQCGFYRGLIVFSMNLQETVFWPLTSGCLYLLFLLFGTVFLTLLTKLSVFSSLLGRHHLGEAWLDLHAIPMWVRETKCSLRACSSLLTALVPAVVAACLMPSETHLPLSLQQIVQQREIVGTQEIITQWIKEIA